MILTLDAAWASIARVQLPQSIVQLGLKLGDRSCVLLEIPGPIRIFRLVLGSQLSLQGQRCFQGSAPAATTTSLALPLHRRSRTGPRSSRWRRCWRCCPSNASRCCFPQPQACSCSRFRLFASHRHPLETFLELRNAQEFCLALGLLSRRHCHADTQWSGILSIHDNAGVELRDGERKSTELKDASGLRDECNRAGNFCLEGIGSFHGCGPSGSARL
mmetsp:Transcript_97227/g.203090  ORF Transcript_97227/g.203090 Transcript_97227/m.203090 type:complete len:217 (-) Transcript_97227:163-813(-)